MAPEAGAFILRLLLADPGLAVIVAFVAVALVLLTETWARPTVEAAKAKYSWWRYLIDARAQTAAIASLLSKTVDPGVHYIRAVLSRWAVAHVRPAVRWLTGVNALSHMLFVQMQGLAHDTAQAIDRVHDVWIPRSLHRAEAFAKHGIDALHHSLSRELARLRRYALGIDRLVRHTILPRVHRLTHAVEHAIPRELGRIRTRVGSIEREIPRGLRHRLTRVEKLLAGGALVGLVVRTLARRFPWLFCRKVTTLGKRLCGLDDSLLAGLLQDALIIAGIVSVVEFTEGLQAIEDEALKLLGGFIEEMPSP